MFDTSGYGLEVGPSYSPLLPKSEGFNVKSLDHADQEALVTKYKVIDHPVWNIEPVDYVSDGRPMTEVIGETEIFDFIIASHVIEHTTDLIGFIQECEALLKPDGVLVLAVPDKRFCFDYYKPISSLGQVIQAHDEKRTRHTPAAHFDHHFYHSERGGKVVWMQYDSLDVRTVNNDVKHAKWVMDLQTGKPHYEDAHNWIFTPSSFRLAMKAMAEMGYVNLVESQFIGSDNHEFYITFKRGGAGCPLSFQDLLTKQMEELRHRPSTTKTYLREFYRRYLRPLRKSL